MGENELRQSGQMGHVGNVSTVPVGNGDDGASLHSSACHNDSTAASSGYFSGNQRNNITIDEERGRRCGEYKRIQEELKWTLSKMENTLNGMNAVLAESGQETFTDIQFMFIIDFLRTFFIPKWNMASAEYRRNYTWYKYTSLLQVTLNLMSLVLSAVMQTFADSTGEWEQPIRVTAMMITVFSVMHTVVSAIHSLFSPDETARKRLIERVELERAWYAFVWGETQNFEIAGKTLCYNFWLDEFGCKVRPWEAYRKFAVACSGAASVGTNAVLSLLAEERKSTATQSGNRKQGKHMDTASSH